MIADPVLELARAVAGARGFAELTAQLGRALRGEGAAREPAIRLWLLGPEGPREASRDPLGADLPERDPDLIERSASTPAPTDDGSLLAPVSCEGKPLGVIELRDATPAHAEVIATAAEVIGARLQSLLISEQQQERLPHVPATDLAAEIDEVVSAFATQAQRQLPHDRLSIYLLTSDGAALERFAVASSPEIPGDKDVQPLEDVGIARVIRTNEPIVSADFGTDERILGEQDSIVAAAGYHAIVSVPLRHRGRPFGLLNFISRTPGLYSERDAVLAQQIADQVAAFLRDLRLQQTIRDSLRRETVRRERERVAREFHDTLAQALADISLRAEMLSETLEGSEGSGAAEAERLHELAHGALVEVRRAIFDPVPAELRGQPLGAAVRRAVERLRNEAGLAPTLEITGDPERLSFQLKSAVLRVLQEALANVRRHARAGAVTVTLHVREEEAGLIVEDDGCGFDGDGAGGFGLKSMRERAEEVGGRLEVRSSAGGPTSVALRAPLMSGAASERDPKSGEGVSPGEMSYPPPVATRVLVVDDHPVFRTGIAELLGREPGMRVVGQVGTGQECLGAVELLKPDLVLLDLSLPDISGVEVARHLGETAEPPVVLVTSAFTEGKSVAEALDAGARGYVSKSIAGSELVDAIRATLRGATVLNATEWSQISRSEVELSTRELEVLELLAAGNTNAEIAQSLHLATKTIEHVVSRTASKLEARNRTHAVALAIGQGLVSAGREPAPARPRGPR
jgi:signal transduction histidine kinase/DNA-binding NarL/FixJ family response regulator